MSGGKGGSSTTTVEVPEYIEDAARKNLARADEIAKIGYTPYYGADAAAFTPMQQASFQNTADTASAFGMAAPASEQDIMGGMPAPKTFAGGVQGYSAAPMYEQSVSALARARPGQYRATMAPFSNPVTGQDPAAPFSPNSYAPPPPPPPSGGGGCVVATHAVESGAFTPQMKREAVVWCMQALHGKWWGEAVRRGYRHLGRKKIEQGKAREHYAEFSRYIQFANGKKRDVRGALTFALRTAQFFAVGLVKKDA